MEHISKFNESFTRRINDFKDFKEVVEKMLPDHDTYYFKFTGVESGTFYYKTYALYVEDVKFTGVTNKYQIMNFYDFTPYGCSMKLRISKDKYKYREHLDFKVVINSVKEYLERLNVHEMVKDLRVELITSPSRLLPPPIPKMTVEEEYPCTNMSGECGTCRKCLERKAYSKFLNKKY